MQTISPVDFPDEEIQRFGLLMKSIGRHMALRDPLVGPAPAESEFSSSQIHALISCGSEGRLTMGELAKRLCVTEKTITGVVDRLERDGYLQRQRDPNDRRVIHVVLTDRGSEKWRGFDQAMRRRFASFLSLLDPPDRTALYDILDKVCTRLSEQASAGSKANH